MITSTTTTLRPINIAFLVDMNDKKALEEVIFINSYLWGGAYNAIIPVYKRIPTSYKKDFFRKTTLEIIEGYIQNYDPDFIVNLSSFDIKKLKNRDRGKDWTVVTKADILGKYGSTAIPNIGIGLDEILVYLEDKEFKYVRKNPVPIYDIQMPKRYKQFYSSVFGAIEPSVWDKITKRFEKSLGMKALPIEKDSYLEALKGENWFIRRFTDYFLKRHSGDNFTSGYVMYMDANNWHDIVDFINLRATGASVLPIIKQGVSTENIKYIKKYIKNNTGKHKYNKSIEYTPNLLKARSITEEDFNAFVDGISKSYPEKERPQLTVQHWYPRLWDREDRNRHSTGQSVVDVSNFRQSFSTDEAEVKLIKPRFGADDFDIKYQFANDIKFDVIGADNYYAEVLGETEQLASHILGSHNYDHWRISQRGATYIASGWERDEKTVRLKVPKAEKFFASWYKNQTNTNIELSTPGKVAKQMLKKLGGPDRIMVLANEGIIKLIQKTVGNGSSAPTLTSKALMGELSKIANKSSRMWDAKGLLGWLLHVGALELGTEIQCPHCDKHNWYPLNKLDNVLVCEKCLDEYEVPKDNPQQGLVWTYSLVGPFRLPKMADGAYTTLLALYFLNETMHFSMTPHLSFQKPKDTDVEADFGLLIHDRSYAGTKVSSALGECKSFKGEFEAKDVNRMKNMAKALDDPILIFATLKTKLDKGEKRRLSQLLISQRKARLKNGNKSRLLILTGNELFSDHIGLQKQWEGLTKKHKELANHIGSANMAELCDATQQLYLSSQSESDWFKEVFEHKRETAKIKEV